jgi:SAM-dependent methyltransferase
MTMTNDEKKRALLANLPMLCCPRCEGDLGGGDNRLVCSECREIFPVSDNIPLMFVPNEWSEDREDVTADVKAFYEETPFPNYEEFDSVGSLILKAQQGRFAKLLDDQIPPNSLVLECGCGTGQLSNFLSIANRTVFGTDICLNSLRLGQEFKERNGLRGVHFLQMNLFRPAVKQGTFDLVVANGVLHHTSDPLLGLESISRLVKPNGHAIVGLYHRYGRLITDLRRLVFRASGERFSFLDPNLRRTGLGSERRRAWFRDQYRHPHESKHTIGEVIRWLERTGLQFVKSLPPSKPFQPVSESEALFDPEEPGNRLERFAAELGMIPRGSREGGFFVVVARKIARPD